MELSAFQRVAHGFEHGGIRVELDPERCPNGDVAAGWMVDTETGERVGELSSTLIRRSDALAVRYDSQYLDEAYQARGFSSAFSRHRARAHRQLGVRFNLLHARDAGAVVWFRLGYDFDLEGVEGPDEARRRARSVAQIFRPDAPRRSRLRLFGRPLLRHPNPHGVLRGLARRSPAGARAAAAMRARIPTEDQIDSGELGGTFTSPRELYEFEAEGVPVGALAMRRAHWDGIRDVTFPE